MTPRERLERVLVVLTKLVEEGKDAKYNQSHFAVLYVEEGENRDDILRENGIDPQLMPRVLLQPLECHTSACALGWAGFDPILQAEGLLWTYKNTYGFFFDGMYQLRLLDETVSFGALQSFFGVGEAHAEALFGGAFSATLSQKVQQLKLFLDTGEMRSASQFVEG